jgi:hypothetical protein
MENVSMEAALSFLYGFDYALGDFGDFQEERAGLSFVQDSVHRHKRLPGVQVSGGKTRLAGRLPQSRKVTKRGLPTTFQCGRRRAWCSINGIVRRTQENSQAILLLRSRLKAGCSQDWLPHYA